MKDNFDEKASLPLDARSAGGSSGLFFLTVPTMVIFHFRICWLSSISSTHNLNFYLCVSLWCVNYFITAGSKMTLRQSLYSGGVQLSWKYEQRRCFTFSNVGVTLGKVIQFKVEKI